MAISLIITDRIFFVAPIVFMAAQRLVVIFEVTSWDWAKLCAVEIVPPGSQEFQDALGIKRRPIFDYVRIRITRLIIDHDAR